MEFELVTYYLVVPRDQGGLRCDQSPADPLAYLVSKLAKKRPGRNIKTEASVVTWAFHKCEHAQVHYLYFQ